MPPSTAQPANSADPLVMILAGCQIPAAEASSQAGANAATAAPAAAGAGPQAAPAAPELPPATASSDGSGLEDMDEDEDMEEEVEIVDDAGESHLWVFIVLAHYCSLQPLHSPDKNRHVHATSLPIPMLHNALPASQQQQSPSVFCWFMQLHRLFQCFALLCICANTALTHRQYATCIGSDLLQSHLCLQGYCYARAL